MPLASAFATDRSGHRIASDLGAVAFTVAVSGFLCVWAVGAASGPWKLALFLPTGALFAFALWVGYVALTRCRYWVRVAADGSCEFRALLRRKRVHVREILALERRSSSLFWSWCEGQSGPDYTKVVFRGGSVIVVQPLDGFEELRALLEAR